MAAGRRTTNIRKYRRPLNINIGLVIFACIFVYMIICVFMYFTSSHPRGYEVKIGSLSVSNIYKGIAIRDEVVVVSEDSGYINYYAREGERVGVGNLIYTVDESGRLADLINSGELGENALSEANLKEIKAEIVGFQNGFTAADFAKVYDFKYEMKGTVLKFANNILENLDVLNASGIGDLVKFCKSSQSGIIVYNVDGLENLLPEAVTRDLFTQEDYKKTQLISNELIGTADPAYKMVLNEQWSIIIPVEEKRAKELEEAGYVKVKFLKNQETLWGQVQRYENTDGNYISLTFNQCMITFCAERFIDIEIITSDEQGLKIPNSAIVEKDFFLIPKEYLTKGKGNVEGFMRETYSEDGSITTEFITPSIYYSTDSEYYVDDILLRAGDYMIKPDSMEKYPVSKRDSLIGVYNINKGYADFKQIIILAQNEEYAIVQSNTEYGLSVFDRIVLDAKTVNVNDFIFD